MKLLKSPLFFRIVLSSLLVVAVLGGSLVRLTRYHEELEHQFDLLVRHDLRLADQAEVLLRLTIDLETGKRSFLRTGNPVVLETYSSARRELGPVLAAVRATADEAAERHAIDEFDALLAPWLEQVAGPQIEGRSRGQNYDSLAIEGDRGTFERMRAILTRLRDDAVATAELRDKSAFDATQATRRATMSGIALAIVLALVSGVWIALDLARATRRLQDALDATGRLEAIEPLPRRGDELGRVGDSLVSMADLLRQKDASLRATLEQREAALLSLTAANTELVEKSRMLEEQGRELERANRVKTEFLASVSHELRTPLNAILGFADLSLASSKEPLSPRTRESLERIRRNGAHLLGLINDVLDLAKVEAGRVDVRPISVDLGALARSSLAEVESLRSGVDVRLAFSAPAERVVLTTDPQRVKQILLNLLSNALKFTDSGEVRLELRAGDADVTLSVVDTGAGIPERELGELFRAFHQLDRGDGRRYEGTGIGLALSRRLARALGGDIVVASEVGRGSAFSLVLPRRERVEAGFALATSDEAQA